MNNPIKRLRLPLLALLAVVSTTIFLTSCLKTDTASNTNPGAAGILAFNLAPDQSSVTFAISGNVITTQPIAYTNYTGSYFGIYPGTGTVDAYNYNTGVKIVTGDVTTLAANKYYSAFLVGKDSLLQNIVVEDQLDTLPFVTGSAYVRYINAVADSTNPTVKVSSAVTEIISNVAPFKSISDFKAITAGDISVSINNESNSIAANRTFSVEAGKIYTILLIGKPGVTDPTSPNVVQIKYIANGTITP